MREDSELVELAAGGDSAAFAELYERYFDNVYDFLARMVRNSEEAADLAQDTFVRAMNSLPSLTKGGSFKSWLFTIARNTALNRLERSSRTQPLEQQSEEGEILELQIVDPDRFSNPEEAAEANSYAGLVWEAASSLDPRQYSALHYSVRLGFDNDELAEVLGVTRNNAYQIINRTKQALESAIGALVLLRQGRRQCRELNALLENLQVGEMTPEIRRLIDRHATKCDSCRDRRRKLASPFGIFAGLVFLQPAIGVRAAILENVQAGFARTYGANAAQSSAAMPMSETLPYQGGADGGGSWPGASAEGEGNRGGGRWKFALVGTGAGVLLLLLGSAAAFSFGFVGGDEVKSAVVESTPTPLPTALAAAPDPTDTPTPSPAATETPSIETPEPQNAAPAPTQLPLENPPTAAPTVEQPTETATSTASPTPTVRPSPTPTNCSITMTVSAATLNFEDDKSSLPLTIGIEGCDWNVDYALTPSDSWIIPIPNQGNIPADGEVYITVRIDRKQLSAGKQYSGQIVIRSVIDSGQDPLTVQVKAQGAGQAPGSFRLP